MNKDLVKQNINLLEYPLWFQDERLAETKRGQIWQDREGYIFQAGYKMPVKTDSIFLLYLLLQSQRLDYAQELTLTRYQVLKDCGLVLSQIWYDRLEDSLERWKMVGIKFEGSFYDGKSYAAMNFGIIDSWKIDEQTKSLKIRFSKEFLTMMVGKGFFKFINFTEFKQLHSPLATRLYEILCKSFHGRDLWEIEAVKLAEKIPMKERYAAHIIPKITTAVSRINQCTQSRFDLTTRTVKRGHVVFSFRKLEDVNPVSITTAPPEKTVTIPENSEVKALIELLPANRQAQKTILEIVLGFYEMRGAAYVARNIRYTNKHATQNYRPYLLKALRADYGLAMQEDEEAKRQVKEQEAQRASVAAAGQAEEDRRRKQEAEIQKRAQAYIAGLTLEARADLETEAIAAAEEKIRTIILKKGMGSRIMLNIVMEKAAALRLEAAKTESQPNLPTMEAEG